MKSISNPSLEPRLKSWKAMTKHQKVAHRIEGLLAWASWIESECDNELEECKEILNETRIH